VTKVKVSGKWRGIAFAQPANQHQRMLSLRRQQALGHVDLKAVASVDVLNGPANGREIRGTIEITRNLAMPWHRVLRTQFRRVQRLSDQIGNLLRRTAQPLLNRSQATFRAPSASHRIEFWESRRNDPGPILVMVECDDPIIETDGQIRRCKLIPARPWQAFEMVAEIVAE